MLCIGAVTYMYIFMIIYVYWLVNVGQIQFSAEIYADSRMFDSYEVGTGFETFVPNDAFYARSNSLADTRPILTTLFRDEKGIHLCLYICMYLYIYLYLYVYIYAIHILQLCFITFMYIYRLIIFRLLLLWL